MKASLLGYLILVSTTACSSLPTYVPPTDNYATFLLKGVNGTPKPLIMFQQDPIECSGAMKWDVKGAPCPCEPNAPPLPIPAGKEIMFFLWQGQSGGNATYESCNLFLSFKPKPASDYTLLFDHSGGLCKLKLLERDGVDEKEITEQLKIKNKSCESK